MKDFTELKEFPNFFIAHSPARLMVITNGIKRVCSQTPNSKADPYWTVSVKNCAGETKKRSMHRLLMQTFVPNPENKAHVNHIDGVKSNNALDNLEWATPKENSQHAAAIGLSNGDWAKKEVYQYNLDGTFVAKFQCDTKAQKATGIPKQNISKVTVGGRIHAGFFRWSRVKEELQPLKRRYVKSYTYKGKEYKNMKELGKTFNIPKIDKLGKLTLLKYLDSPLYTNYYK